MTVGQIVKVKSGQGKDSLMIVIKVEERYLYLVDGRRRKLLRPKKKNIKHVSSTKVVASLIPHCGRDLQDADIRKALRIFALKEVSHIV